MEISLRVHVVPRILSNISGYTGPIFTIFSPYESALRADDGSLPYFPISQGTLPWQPNHLWMSGITHPKNWRILSYISGYGGPIFTIFLPWRAAFMSMIDLKFLFQYLKGRCYGNEIICERQVQHGQNTGVFCQIFPDILDLFSQSFHRMKALYVQMMAPYFFFQIWSTSVQ